VKGASKSTGNLRTWFEPVQAEQQIVSGPPFRPAAFGTGLFEPRQAAMPRETFAQGLPVAGVEGLERGGRERRFSLGAGLPTAWQASRRQSRMPVAQGSLSSAIRALSSRRR
jgi:hypothetical protein